MIIKRPCWPPGTPYTPPSKTLKFLLTPWDPPDAPLGPVGPRRPRWPSALRSYWRAPWPLGTPWRPLWPRGNPLTSPLTPKDPLGALLDSLGPPRRSPGPLEPLDVPLDRLGIPWSNSSINYNSLGGLVILINSPCCAREFYFPGLACSPFSVVKGCPLLSSDILLKVPRMTCFS